LLATLERRQFTISHSAIVACNERDLHIVREAGIGTKHSVHASELWMLNGQARPIHATNIASCVAGIRSEEQAVHLQRAAGRRVDESR
jgi:hypothetical protein